MSTKLASNAGYTIETGCIQDTFWLLYYGTYIHFFNKDELESLRSLLGCPLTRTELIREELEATLW